MQGKQDWFELLDLGWVPLQMGMKARRPVFCPEGPAPSGEGLWDPTTVGVFPLSAWASPLGPVSGFWGAVSYRADSTAVSQQSHSWLERIKLNLLQVKGISSHPCSFPIDCFALMLKGEVGDG